MQSDPYISNGIGNLHIGRSVDIHGITILYDRLVSCFHSHRRLVNNLRLLQKKIISMLSYSITILISYTSMMYSKRKTLHYITKEMYFSL